MGGPLNLEKALKNRALKNGDKLLIHDGIYSDFSGVNNIDKDICLIGLGNDALIKCDYWHNYHLFNIQSQNVHIENISFCGQRMKMFDNIEQEVSIFTIVSDGYVSKKKTANSIHFRAL